VAVVIVLAVLAVVVLASLGAVAVTRRRGRRPELEPPARRPVSPPAPRPSETLAEARAEPAVAEPAVAGAAPVAPAPEPEAPEVSPELVPEVAPVEPAPPAAVAPEAPEEVEAPPRFRDRLGKARTLLATYVSAVMSRSAIDDETWDDLEEALIRADVGVATTAAILDDLRAKAKEHSINSPDALLEALKNDMKGSLARTDRHLSFEPGVPNVWLFVGVNGVGKTTTIGKLGLREAGRGHTVVMAAADTFRAAAAEQLQLWAERVGADVVRGAEGGDPGSVVFDAVERASARGADLVLADTAGRLHTKVNLMEELKKVRRVAERPPGRVTEVLLVLDATTGQNGLIQAREFTEAVGVTGVVLTKLDGTAKGGIALAVESDLDLPIKLVGLGEKAADLVDFDPEEFVEALFA
jgi:fused signal recognition particle receptor